MLAFVIRRLLYSIPVALGVYAITFALFHIRDPMAMARTNLPQAPVPVLQNWVRANGYHLPYFLNLPFMAEEVRADGRIHPEFKEHGLFYSRFFLGLRDLLTADFGRDRSGRMISQEIARRAGPSFLLMAPSFFLTILISLALSVLAAYRRGQLNESLRLVSVSLMSLPMPAFLLASGWIFGDVVRLFPIHGSVTPAIAVAVVAGIGSNIRFFSTVLADSVTAPHVRAARLRGAADHVLMLRHILRNTMIPILTTVVISLPFLITGSLLLEQFYGIAGMGDMLFTAILAQDFPVIRALVYLGAFLYMIGNILTDISYALADPRIRLE
jgi:peptide/nickel transport system permease protein